MVIKYRSNEFSYFTRKRGNEKKILSTVTRGTKCMDTNPGIDFLPSAAPGLGKSSSDASLKAFNVFSPSLYPSVSDLYNEHFNDQPL